MGREHIISRKCLCLYSHKTKTGTVLLDDDLIQKELDKNPMFINIIKERLSKNQQTKFKGYLTMSDFGLLDDEK